MCLNRSLFEHEFWQEPRTFSRAEAWLDILQSVRWAKEPQEVTIQGHPHMIHRGQVIKSQKIWADRWGWDRNKVRRFLKDLEDKRLVEHKTTRKCAKLTVLNLSSWVYQRSKSEHKTTIEEISKRNLKERNKEINKEKKKEKPSQSNCEGTVLSNPRKKGQSPTLDHYEIADRLIEIVQSRKNVRVPSAQRSAWAGHIRKLESLNGVAVERMRSALDIWTSDVNQEYDYWPHIESGKAFREKFVKLEGHCRSFGRPKHNGVEDQEARLKREMGALQF